MTIYQFTHPVKNIEYTWNLGEGLLFRNRANPIVLNRSTLKGELLYRLLEYKRITQFGTILNGNLRPEITVRTYLPKIMDALNVGTERKLFIKSLHGHGYQWLLDVKKIQESAESEQEVLMEFQSTNQKPTGKKLLFLHGIASCDVERFSSQIIDASVLVNEKVRDFVGRKHVFNKIEMFLKTRDCGYFVIKGDPGIGKTAILAKLLVEKRYVHHFNVRAENIVSTDCFLQNLCAQLIVKYDLPYEELPPEMQDASFLKELLAEVSRKLQEDEQAVILVDALDEADEAKTGVNTLVLPLTLPQGVYVVATTRRTTDVKLYFESPHEFFNLDHDADHNLKDLDLYIQNAMEMPGILQYMQYQKLTGSCFKNWIAEKSEGNFMYLRCVLPEIGYGAYQNRPIEAVPKGLHSYYEDHWWRMRGANEDDWFKYKLPVVLALTIACEPVSISLLSQFADVPERRMIYKVLNDWRQFLHIRLYSDESPPEKRYRIYHTSYLEFISAKDEIQEEAAENGIKREVNLKEAHQKIADVLIQDLIQTGVLDKDFNNI